MTDFTAAASQIMGRLEKLGRISQSEQYLDRRYLTDEHMRTNQLVAKWMAEASMHTWQDAAGNLWGRYPSSTSNAPRFIIGSHLDTVPNGGKYDGMLGVIAPITLVSLLAQVQHTFPFHLDIVGFGDEEGTRFGTTLLGSRALSGKWLASWGELKDQDGVTLAQAMKNFGLDFDLVSDAALSATELLGYVELHIEQGPVLEGEGLAVGVVSAIAGARRLEIAVTGSAGHAGTVPMSMRQDALCATSEMILAIEKMAREQNLVATVGKIVNRPNGVNVISGSTTFSLDIRSEDDRHRDTVLEQIMLKLEQIAAQRGVALSSTQTHNAPAVRCDALLQERLEKAIKACGYRPYTLASGAGHDAMAMADICPVAMLFTRCDRGISHHPAEAIMQEDVATSLAVMHHMLCNLSS
ncbi:allantoate amidohydrolase [Alteromonas pelagimontana]|uniref:Allantoate amidohydrolase n=1 Tax=Alteromonas pelagimontana TaxID=1858656 RepID=A0A6M4MBK1_9ALTE|nr:allantoate amidohydrolase [Alteromonas pelagimontana]QJR79536.1 allantoate amidohydrolase [Alteromonas pelagimontana]